MIPLRDTIPSRRVPVVTWSLIFINGLVFLWELGLAPDELEAVFYLFGIVPARYTHPAWADAWGFPVDDAWPFVTSMFLHGGWAHLIGNMWTLYIFGDNVEDRMGPVRYLGFYLLTGLIAGATHWFTNADSVVPTVGASGAVAGVLGAYFVLYPRARIIVLLPVFIFPFFFMLPAVTYLAFWVLSQVVGGALAGLGPDDVGGIAFWAHVGGFLAGVALHRLFIPGEARVERRWYDDESLIEGPWAGRARRR